MNTAWKLSTYYNFKNQWFWTSLVVQWLRLWAPNVEVQGLIPGPGTRPHMPQLRAHMLQTKTQHSQLNLKTKNSDSRLPQQSTTWDSVLPSQWSESHSVVSDSLRPHGLYSLWNSPGQNTGVGSHSLLQRIFPNQGSNPGLPHGRRILYQLSHQGSPRILEWVAYLFSSGDLTQESNHGFLHCRWIL